MARTLCKLQSRLIALDASRPKISQNAQFDTDLALLRINNCATVCILNCIEDFKVPLTPMQPKIQGIGSNIGAMQRDTFAFLLEDDEGKVHNFHIPFGCVYRPKPTACVLHVPDYDPSNRPCLATIPRKTGPFLSNRQEATRSLPNQVTLAEEMRI